MSDTRDDPPPTWCDDDEVAPAEIVDPAPVAIIDNYCASDERARLRLRPYRLEDYREAEQAESDRSVRTPMHT